MRLRLARGLRAAALLVALVASLVAAPASAQKAGPVVAPPPSPTVAPPPSVPAPVAPAPAPVAPLVPAPPPVEVVIAPEPAPPPVVIAPVPTADATEAASDHDAVVGHVGVEVRSLGAAPFGFALRPTGCPATQTTPCEAFVGAVAARYWRSRNVAFTGGLALGFGGGKDGPRTLDSYAAVGPLVGASLLLGNWRHLAVLASPDLSFVWFKPAVGDSGASTKVVTLRAMLEGELHFGFLGVPAFSVGVATGLGFRWVDTQAGNAWAVGVSGPGSVMSVLNNFFVRYYL
jgi:hypothetical protein